MALNVLGKQFDKLLNVTLCYPDNNRQPFFDMLSGKLTRIVVHVDLQPIADELHGDYINDKSFKRHFQQWLNSLWQEKDRLLTSLMSSQRQASKFCSPLNEQRRVSILMNKRPARDINSSSLIPVR